MKKAGFAIAFICILIQFPMLAQTIGWDQVLIQFKDTVGMNAYYLENEPGMQNIWQQAVPGKSQLGPPNITDRVMVTQADTAYPPDNQSSFTVPFVMNCDPCIHLLLIGRYWVHTDSLQDYGSLLFSPDNGNLWIDLINDTNIVPLSSWKYFQTDPFRPVLTGNSNGWVNFEGDFVNLLDQYDVKVGDTVLYRFGFTSDNNHNGKDGLAYNYLRFDQQYLFTEVQEINLRDVKIYPNPSDDLFTIENPISDIPLVVEVFNSQGRILLRDKLQPGRNKIDASTFPNGIYPYRIISLNGDQNRSGRLVVSHN